MEKERREGLLRFREGVSESLPGQNSRRSGATLVCAVSMLMIDRTLRRDRGSTQLQSLLRRYSGNTGQEPACIVPMAEIGVPFVAKAIVIMNGSPNIDPNIIFLKVLKFLP